MTIKERAFRLTLAAPALAALCLLLSFRGARAFVSGENANLVLGQSTFSLNVATTTGNGANDVTDIVFDNSGNAWVADFNNNRVLEFKPPFSTGMSASLVLGQSSFTTNSFSASSNGLHAPNGLAFDSSGNLWVADAGNDRVVEFAKPFVSGMSASLVLGQTGFGIAVPSASQTGMNQPSSLAFDSSGNLWVSDGGNSRVLEFTNLAVSGSSASLVLGQAGFGTSASSSSSTGMNSPNGLVFDSTGDLWVADLGNNRVLEFSPAPISNDAPASFVLGQANLNSNIAAAGQSGMAFPHDVRFDSFGNLWVADEQNNRILEFLPPFSTNGMSASLVLGQQDFISSAAATTQNGLRAPIFLAFDSAGNLWEAENTNNRWMRFPGGMPSGCAYGYNVRQDGSQNFTSIQAAVNALPSSLSGPTCVVIQDTGTYNESVSVSGFTNNGSSITIMAVPGDPSPPIITPPTGPAFNIAQASVTIHGLKIAPIVAMQNGISISSPDVVIDSVSIVDAGNVIGVAGIFLNGSGFDTIRNSTVSVQAASGLVLSSPGNVISASSVTDNSPNNHALIFEAGASGNQVSNSYFANSSGATVLVAGPGADNNSLSQSTLSANNSPSVALQLSSATLNTFNGDRIVNPLGGAVSLVSGSSSNTISQSVVLSTSSSYAALSIDASCLSDTIQTTRVSNFSGAGAIINGSSHSITQSTFTASSGNWALQIQGNGNSISQSYVPSLSPGIMIKGSSNTVSASVINTGGTALELVSASDSLISQSTVASSGATGLYLSYASSTTVSQSYVSGTEAAEIFTSTSTNINGTALIGTNSSQIAFYVTNQSSGVALANDAVSGGSMGIDFSLGGSGVLSLSSVSISGSSTGLEIDSQTSTAILSVSSVTFASLMPGATAIGFSGGVFNSTFSSVDFADNSVGANVNASALASPSSIVMSGSFGPRTGPGYADDPNHVILWPGLPLSAVTYPANNAAVNNLLTISGTAASVNSSTIALVSIALQNIAANTWWNGSVSAWQTAQSWSSATYVGADSGTWSWSLNTPLITYLQGNSGTSYHILSQAADSSGRTQYPPGISTFTFDNTPPTSGVALPINGSMVSNLPTISGTAGALPGVAVASVSIEVQDLNTGYCYNPSSGFTSACPAFSPVSIFAGVWSSTGIPTSAWASGHQYLIVSSATDAAGNVQNVFNFGQSSITFTFGGLGAGTFGDGEGSATLTPSSSQGCQVLVATISYVVGASTIQAYGGMIAVNIPPGWSGLQGEDSANDPPLNPGFVHVVSSVAYGMQFNPAEISSQTLGTNWMVYSASAPLSPGTTIQFVYKGYPPGGPLAQGPQVFAVLVQAGPGGNLRPIAALPSMNLTPGPAANLAFVPNSPLALGPLQNSPTMYLEVTDACGISTTASVAVVASLSGSVNGNQDLNANFYSSGSTETQVIIPPGASQSPGFYFNTSTSAPYENLIASTTVAGFGASYASRYIQLFSSSASISGVSVDTGAPGSSLSASIVQNGSADGVAFINFSLSNPGLGWEVAVSSSPTSFYPKVADFFGTGSPGRTVAWNGLNDMVYPNSFVSTGTYYVEIIAGGGAAINTSLSVSVSAGASIYGVVANGAGASVSVMGPSVGPGNSAQADAGGNFVVPGLQSGGVYSVQVSSMLILAGAPVNVSTGTSNITASATGTNVGTLTLPVPSYIAVSATLPQAAQSEIWGGVSAHDASYSNTANAALHFSQGSAQSDNGAQSFGVAASTWTQLFLPPGTYEVDVNLPSINLSTSVFNVSLTGGSSVDLPVFLSKQADVYGYAFLPAAASTGTPVSVQAFPAGSSNGQGGVFGGTFVPPGVSSGIYSLFGLSPGSWTVTARSMGYVDASSTVFISSNADVGTAAGGGFNLTLQTGGVIFGTMTVTGDSSQESASSTCGMSGSGFCVRINAYGPAAISGQGISVHLATSATQTSSTFTISGLPDGAYFLKSSLPGFVGGAQNAVVSGGSGGASLNMSAASDGLEINVILPGGGNFSDVSLGYADNQGDSKSFDDIAQIPGLTSSGSTATAVFSGLNPGLYSIDAFNKADGIFRQVSAAVSAGTTTAVNLDMSGSTYSVQGSLSFSGALSVPEPGGLTVMVSSAAGWISQVSTMAYCVMGSSNGVTLSAAQMQLLPAGPNNGDFYGGTLQTPSNCSNMMTGGSNNQGNANPFHVYLATIAADGTFDFSGIPPGLYQLRNNSRMDSSGDSVPQFSQVILVTGPVSGISFPIGSGYSISGNVLAPAQTSLSRQIYLRLTDQNNNPVGQQLVVSFNNSSSASFLFPQVPPGSYLIQAQDGGYPQAYAAAPLAVKVGGQNLSNQTLQLVPSGTIKFNVAIEQKTSAGAQFLRVTQNNASLLPSSFQIQAVADPWFNGGYGFAQSQGGLLILDSNGQGTIAGLLPGTYDVDMAFQNGPSVGSAGLVASSVSGVKVTGGAVTDVGTINALLGDQISGRVTDGSGNPLPNINLVARIAQRSAGVQFQELSAVTDGNGYYALNGLDPNVRYYDIYAAYRGDEEHEGEFLPHYEQQADESVDVSSVTSLNFSLAQAPYSVIGQVLAPAGGPSLIIPFNNGHNNGNNAVQAPQPGAAVFLQKVGIPPTRTPLGDIRFNTDLNGNFSIPSLATGTYRMTIVSQGYSSFQENVLISSASVNLGTITMSQGPTLSGTLATASGGSPSTSQIQNLIAAAPNLSSVLVGSLQTNSQAQTISGYSVSGFKLGTAYEILMLDSNGNMVTPQEGRDIVFNSTAPMTLNMVYRPSPPLVMAKAFRQGNGFDIEFDLSQPLRDETSADDNASLILSTVSAQGTLSDEAISQDRTEVTAFYTPSVSESSFTLRLNGYSNVTNPDSLDQTNPQFIAQSTVTFYTGIGGLSQSNIQNYIGGNVIAQGESGRVTLPANAFNVNISSSVQVTLQLAEEALNTSNQSVSALSGAQRIESLSHAPASYPSQLLSAVAAVPPSVNPLSSFYNIFLPLGVSTLLSSPAQLTISYSTSVADPSSLNVYWYNALANAYVLQQDVTGTSPVIDTVNHTITISVSHFSTYVLFNSNQALISSGSGATDFSAHNFPNPFDLTVKTVQPQHTGGSCGSSCSIRGTMIAVSIPPGTSGSASIDIFNVVGTKVRHIDLGSVSGGNYYYQNWDGTNDAGRDVASGVYFGELKVGGQKAFFKMAVIKGSGL